MTSTAIVLVYALPALLSVGACFLAWRGEDSDARGPWLEVVGIGLALIVGFCALEVRWPWELHSPWRRHYWIPVGIIALMTLHRLRVTKWAQLAVAAVGLWLLLHRYAFQLNEDWTDLQHLGLLGAMLAFASVAFLGHWKLSESTHGSFLQVHLGILVSGAGLYAFLGTSSAKVAQWMSVIGCVFAGVFLLTLWLKPLRLQPTAVLLASWFLVGGLCYGFYSGEKSLLSPLAFLVAAPWIGLVSGTWTPRRAGWMVLVWTCICVGAAVAAYFLNRPPVEEEEDYLDAYGLVAPQLDAGDR